MRFSRREMMVSAAAAGMAASAPALAQTSSDADTRLLTLFDRFADDILNHAPETATSLGLDKGVRKQLKRKLSDSSLGALSHDRAACVSRLHAMRQIDRATLNSTNQIRYDAVQYAFQLGADGGKFGYGENTFGAAMGEAATPYVVSQQGGALVSVPEFLNSQHKIETADDCEAYLERLAQFPRQLDQETARIRHDAARDVAPPDFIIDTTLTQARAMRGQIAVNTGMVQSLATRAAALHIEGAWSSRAAHIVETQVYPAVNRQIAALRELRASASHDAGVWKLPDGEAYYDWLLKVGTSTPMTPDEVHALGLTQGAQIDAEMDRILKAHGLRDGSVGARMSQLTRDPRFLKPNTDAGRREVMQYLEGRIAAVRPLLARVSHMHLNAPVEVHRVPVDIQDGAGLGYMNFASLDGSRPAIYYINLKDTALWPLWTLPTLTAHETIPGHAWQGAYLAEHHNEIPLMMSLMGFNAFVEGWALYSEQLVDELGYYEGDDFGRLGYLQAIRFRAARLVVDTGLHAKRWSREQAIQSLIDQTGRAPGAAQSEIDRYVSTPGQACGYKVGQTEILRLRAHARDALGAKFDVRDFDDVVVQTGGVPLTVLATAVDAYIASKS
ncbi:MAG: DUF885 family protein [Terricaulis sp.]